jgi:hypothetical protein
MSHLPAALFGAGRARRQNGSFNDTLTGGFNSQATCKPGYLAAQAMSGRFA